MLVKIQRWRIKINNILRRYWNERPITVQWVPWILGSISSSNTTCDEIAAFTKSPVKSNSYSEYSGSCNKEGHTSPKVHLVSGILVIASHPVCSLSVHLATRSLILLMKWTKEGQIVMGDVLVHSVLEGSSDGIVMMRLLLMAVDTSFHSELGCTHDKSITGIKCRLYCITRGSIPFRRMYAVVGYILP